jgi:hypothetical protein
MSGIDVASGTAGLITLGISVCQGLIWYYKAWDDWENDVRDAVQELEETSNFLQSAQVRLGKLSQKQADIGTYDKPFQDRSEYCKGALGEVGECVLNCMNPVFPYNL